MRCTTLRCVTVFGEKPAPLLPPPPEGTLLLLPQAARAALFAAAPGPAVLLTTPERLPLYAGLEHLGAEATVNPGLKEWGLKKEHVVLDVGTALDLFPAHPGAHVLALRLGGAYPREALLRQLESLGYERADDEDEHGYRVLGDAVELHLPPGFLGGELPDPGGVGMVRLRAEFFGDELDALRLLGAAPHALREVTVSPAEGYLSAEAWDSTRLSLLPGRVFLDGPEFFGSHLGPLLDTLYRALDRREVTAFGHAPLELPAAGVDVQPLPFYRAKLSQVATDVGNWRAGGLRTLIAVRHERTAQYLAETLLNLELRWGVPGPGEVGFVRMAVEGGFAHGDLRLISEDLIYGFQGGSTLRGRKLGGRPVTDALGLSVGDFLIHPENGIGRFEGLETRSVLGVMRDYLHLSYADGAKLYLPIEQLPVLRRHPGTTDDPPKLSKLGGKDWQRIKAKAQKSADDTAARLLVQYAARQVTPGLAYPPNPEWDPMIEANFEHALTPDQETALHEVMADLERAVPMDRLISGDVGFGKTEVAIRAAHRVVGHGRQVAVLVPTTLLADQHTSTFLARFKGLPVRVEGISRFTSAKAASAILRDLKAGQVDIVIGTHRLLSEDVGFGDLGLIVVDEEHRFGVLQKEKLRALKALRELPQNGNGKGGADKLPEGAVSVDVLSLSATPIPRTLYMSMVGLRDMSSIQTPPPGRKPINTVLAPFDPITVRDAIVYEIERGGKAFYIHDRVASIGARALYLRQLVPEARIGVAHGQMNEEDLEEIMLGFEEGAFDVLLSTTIVETGLDIPEANTILIERADRLGLAQLYQLRGRVGRRERSAYAYLFYPPRVTDNASRRLWAIADLTDLGSGHLLAEKDMEIRGIGNILGAEQHGQVQAVSADVYTDMLAQAVARLKGETVPDSAPVAVDLPVSARLSPEYFGDDEAARIGTYGRLSEARSLKAIVRVERELRKKYGPPPTEVQHFIDLAKLRTEAAHRRVSNIGESLTELQITFAYEGLDYDAAALRRFPHPHRVSTFPPALVIEKRGIHPDEYPRVLLSALTYFA